MRVGLWLWFLSIVLAALSASAQTNFSITGSAAVQSALEEQTNAVGNGFFYSSYVGDGPCDVGICYAGQTCDGSDLATTTLAVYSNSYPITHSAGCLQGACAKKGAGGGLNGSLNVVYNFSFITPSTDQQIDIKVPITVSGSVSAIGPSWTVGLTGSGFAELSGNITDGILRFTSMTLHYRGTGTVQ